MRKIKGIKCGRTFVGLDDTFLKVYYPDLLKMPAKPHALMAKLYDEGLKYVSVSGVFGGSEVEQLNILRTTLYVWMRGIS